PSLSTSPPGCLKNSHSLGFSLSASRKYQWSSSGGLVSSRTPVHVGPPWRAGGKRPTRCVTISKTALGSSPASLIHAPVNSKDLSFPISSGLSTGKKKTSISIWVPSFNFPLMVPVIGASHFITHPAAHSCHVLIVVDFSSG